eukprot:4649660-Prymnesium_polylepis.1
MGAWCGVAWRGCKRGVGGAGALGVFGVGGGGDNVEGVGVADRGDEGGGRVAGGGAQRGRGGEVSDLEHLPYEGEGEGQEGGEGWSERRRGSSERRGGGGGSGGGARAVAAVAGSRAYGTRLACARTPPWTRAASWAPNVSASAVSVASSVKTT